MSRLRSPNDKLAAKTSQDAITAAVARADLLVNKKIVNGRRLEQVADLSGCMLPKDDVRMRFRKCMSERVNEGGRWC